MKKTLLPFVAVLLLLSCGQNESKPDQGETIDTTALTDGKLKDSSKLLVSELPVKFAATDIRIFPVGLVDLEERGGYIQQGAGSYGGTDIPSAYFNNDKLSGNFVNLLFQDAEGKERKLTDKNIQIRSVSFLRRIFEKTKASYLLYSITDRDSNGDKQLNQQDTKALYISRVDGSGFKKLTQDLHELYDWGSVSGDNRIYFRTLEDRKKDSEADKQRRLHYYVIGFAGDKYSVSEYDPLKLFK
jgi:hypothetical protein